MDNDDKKVHVKDLIKNFNQQKRIFRPKTVITKTKPVQDDNKTHLVASSDSEEELYDEIQKPPQKHSYLHEEQLETKLDEDELSSDDSQEYPEFGQYLNVPAIVDETKNFLREEENYCQLLADLVENYVEKIKTDKFDDVFGRIDLICTFQNNTFLPELKSSRNVVEIVECFIKHKKLFSTYYEHYFKNLPNMIFIMNDNKDIFWANMSKEQYKDIEKKLIKTLNERILSYNIFLESMKKILVADIDTSNFDRAIAILADLTLLLSPKGGNIRYLISEVVETERVYIEKLERITEQLIPKIQNIIKRKSIQRSIIGNVPVIYKHQLNFHKDLEQCLMTFDPNEVGNCFLQHQNGFLEYIKDQKMKDNPQAIDDCRKLLKNESDKYFDFHAPLSRLYKYKILLQELKKKCDKGCLPSDRVEDAYNAITGIISKMNGVAAINCIQDENLYLDNQGELIIRDEFIVQSKEHRYDAMIYLFEKSLVFTEIKTEGSKKFRSDVFIYRNHIITKRLSITVNTESSTDFQVAFHGKTRKMVHMLKAKDGNTKQVWIDALKKILVKQLEEEREK